MHPGLPGQLRQIRGSPAQSVRVHCTTLPPPSSRNAVSSARAAGTLRSSWPGSRGAAEEQAGRRRTRPGGPEGRHRAPYGPRSPLAPLWQQVPPRRLICRTSCTLPRPWACRAPRARSGPAPASGVDGGRREHRPVLPGQPPGLPYGVVHQGRQVHAVGNGLALPHRHPHGAGRGARPAVRGHRPPGGRRRAGARRPPAHRQFRPRPGGRPRPRQPRRPPLHCGSRGCLDVEADPLAFTRADAEKYLTARPGQGGEHQGARGPGSARELVDSLTSVLPRGSRGHHQ
ncbi:hypothetical protein SALBM311S_06523 [Streptomyces alboniger]